MTKLVRFSDNEVSTSDIEWEEDGGFVTKRTFELLDQDEPFIEKQLRILRETANEHCDTWKENFKEVAGPVLDVVEPMKKNANLCVDCILDAIQRAQLRELILGRPRALAMVGGPAPVLMDEKMRDTESLLSLDSEEKHIMWAVAEILPGVYKEADPFPFREASVARGSILKPNHGIMKKRLVSMQSAQSMFQRIGEAEKEKATEEHKSSAVEVDHFENLGVQAAVKVVHPRDETDRVNEPSGKRPESPIKLFSSRDLDDVTAIEDENFDSEHWLDLATSQNPIVVDDYSCDEMNDDADEMRDDKLVLANDRSPVSTEGEERDEPPSSPILRDSHVDPMDEQSFDFRRIGKFSHHSHLPLSRSLLFSMRSRIRDIDNLLGELPTKYAFGADDELSTQSATASAASKNSNLSLENSIDSTKQFESEQFVGKAPARHRKFRFISFGETKATEQIKAIQHCRDPTTHNPSFEAEWNAK